MSPIASEPKEVRRATSKLTLATLLLSALALLVSLLLLADYTRPDPVFCNAAGSGCAEVRKTVLASFFGIPTPALGTIGFAVLFALRLGVFGRSKWAKIWLAMASLAAGGAALLIAAQFAWHKLCPYCMVVDISALAIAALGWLGFSKSEGLVPLEPTQQLRAGGLAVLAAALVSAFAWNKTADVVVDTSPLTPPPAVIAAELAKGPSGIITILDFTDFECPHCRSLNAGLKPLLSEYGAKVRLVRKHVPLRSIHPHADPAARAAICAEAQTEKLGPEKVEDFADALYAMKPDDMLEFGLEQLARQQGFAMDVFHDCLRSDATKARLAVDRKLYDDAKVEGLPTLYVGPVHLFGGQTKGEMRAAIERALAMQKAATP
jgi:uncharacterized membrane protein/protein-disulfide isomerase